LSVPGETIGWFPGDIPEDKSLRESYEQLQFVSRRITEYFSSLGYKPPAPVAVMPDNEYLAERLTLKMVQWVGAGQLNNSAQ
jgi:hypothetical protein